MSRFSELRNRNVFRVAAAYIVAAWLIIQVVETIFPAFGFGDSAVRIVVIVLAIGIVPVAVFSWLFELTPEGLKLESAVDHTGPEAAHRVKRLDRIIIATLTLAVAFFAFDKFVLNPLRESEIEESTAERVRSETLAESFGKNSIAVLPFVNMSDDAGNEYFSDGLAEELLNLLARIPRLRVISQSSSFSLKGKGLTIPEVAGRLNVALVLEGSVRKSGDRVRVTAQLIDARSDTHIWSENYDRKLDDLFVIQDEVAAAIVTALREHLELDVGAAPRAPATANAEAHDAFLRGRYLMGQRIPGGKTRAAVEFEKAISLDPGFAPAYAERAIALLLGGCGDATEAECLRLARPDSEKAMALDPGLAEAHAAAAWIAYYEGDTDQIRNHFRRAIEINPNFALAYVWMGGMGLFASQQEAFAGGETALRLDPLSPVINYSYVGDLLAQGRLEEADRQIDKYATIDPKSAAILRAYRSSLGGHGSNYILAYLEVASTGTDDLTFAWAAEEDMAWQLAAIGLEDDALGLLGDVNSTAQIWLGDPERALARARAQLETMPNNREAQIDVAFALSQAGNCTEARPWLERNWQFFERISPGWGFSWGVDFIAQALIACLRDAGDEAGATQVLAEYKDYLRSYREAGVRQTERQTSLDWFDGIAAYVAGDRAVGLELMAKAARDGYWIRPAAPFQRSMYDDPGFAPLLEEQKARQAGEQAQVLAVVCTNNPYATVWRPAEETCARYRSTAH